MKVPFDMTVFKDAIHDCISNEVRHAGVKVVWKEQDSPQPDLPFIGLKILSGPVLLSHSWGLQRIDELTRAGKEIELASYVPANLTVSCEAFVSRRDAIDTDLDAMAILSVCRAIFSRESIIQFLSTKGIAFMRSEAPNDLSALEETSFTSRGNIDLVFGITLEDSDFVTYIEKAELKSDELDVEMIVGV